MVDGRPLPNDAHVADDASAPQGAAVSKSRTCVGCGKKVDPRDPTEFTRRIVLGPLVDGAHEIAVDSSQGRGAHVHLIPACVRAAAEKGLRRSFKSALHIEGKPLDAGSLATAIIEMEERRLRGMLVASARSKKSIFGAEAVRSALRTGSARLVVVATDAKAAADLTEVRKAVADGLAVAWGTKALLAELRFGKPSRGAEHVDSDGVAVIAILNRELASAIRGAVMAADSLRSLTVSSGASGARTPGTTVNRAGTSSEKQAVE